jgi:hypothetical protein
MGHLGLQPTGPLLVLLFLWQQLMLLLWLLLPVVTAADMP